MFMSQLFVHWTLNTGDVNRFQSKTKDKHVDLIYTYDFVIVGTGAEFREIGCYPFNFCFFTFFNTCSGSDQSVSKDQRHDNYTNMRVYFHTSE